MKSLQLLHQHQPAAGPAAAVAMPLQPSPETPPRGRRQTSVRYPVDNVMSTLGSGPTAEVLNLSLGGFAVQTSKYLQINRTYSVKLLGPTEHDLTAEVVWCRLIATLRRDRQQVEPVFRAGFKFRDLSRDDRWKLRRLIRQTTTQPGCKIADSCGPDPA